MSARAGHLLRVYGWALLMVVLLVAAVGIFLGFVVTVVVSFMGAANVGLLLVLLLAGIPLAVALSMLGLACASQLIDEVHWG